MLVVATLKENQAPKERHGFGDMSLRQSLRFDLAAFYEQGVPTALSKFDWQAGKDFTEQVMAKTNEFKVAESCAVSPRPQSYHPLLCGLRNVRRQNRTFLPSLRSQAGLGTRR
jgi:hypothetical protein